MSNLAFLPLLKASWETIYMVFIASAISLTLGLGLGCLLYLTNKKAALSNAAIHQSLAFIVNVTRSIPFIILMISIIPFTRLLIGTTIGTNAAIVPLSIAAIPFYARLCEGALANVSSGLLEAADAMGASTWQLVTKLLIPESLPALIRGGTLTIIGIIGYSTMAGVVGGGGLGELAINYGYQQFNVSVMTATVMLLLIMVQVIQWFGDHLAKKRRLKPALYLSLALLFACFTTPLWTATDNARTLRIGIMSGPAERVMAAAKHVAQERYGITLEIIQFSDYVQPNTALDNGSIDANIFQHLPYLEAQANAHHYQLTPIAKTFVYPMGFYSKKINEITSLKHGALIAIPNDPSNQARSLLLLQKAGLISLKKDAGTLATLNDIVSNPKQLHIKLLDAAQIPRTLNDVDLAAITNDFVSAAGFSIQDAVIKEDKDSDYANIIVIKTSDKEDPIYQTLIAIMHSDDVLKATESTYPNGAAIPAWDE